MNDKVKTSRKKLYLSMIKLAIPLIISNFLQNLYNLADTYYMGKLGGIELATASFTSPITQMIIGAGTGFSLGGGVILSQTFGSKNIKKLVEVNTQLIVVNMVIAIIITVLSFGFCEKILVFSGATGVLLEKSSLYIKFIFLTIPMTFIITAYTVIKNSKGKTSAPLHLITVSVILNIILNSFFIYKMNLGLKGIGIATVIANLLLCIYCLIDLSIKREIAREYLKFNKDIFKKILRLGFPSSLTTTTNSLSFILINIFVVKYGNDVLAAYGVGNRINNIIYVLVNGIGSSVAILVGHSIGAGKIKEIREILLAGIKIGLIVGIVSVIFLYWNLDIAVGILTSDEMIKYHSINYLKIMLISVIPWVIFQVLAGVFQGTGHTTFNMYCHVGRIWIFRVPFIYFLERILELKEYSIWYSMLLSNLCALLFSIFLYRKIDWKRRED